MSNVPGAWKDLKQIKLDNNQQIGFWKQKINTEQKQVKHVTAQEILNNNEKINAKNAYIPIF